MSGIITTMKHKSIIVNGTSNHVHILLGLNPSISVSDTVHDIKRSSSLFINNEKLCAGRFSWQEGYGGFSYSRSQIGEIYNYIDNQESHHQKRTFQQEYIDYLNENEMEFDQQFYLISWRIPFNLYEVYCLEKQIFLQYFKPYGLIVFYISGLLKSIDMISPIFKVNIPLFAVGDMVL
jgi:tetrahydromethanopterin S-methyltransferase subunit F